jgi:hypothetical protein
MTEDVFQNPIVLSVIEKYIQFSSLEDFICAVSDIFDNPVLVTDSSFKILAFSKQREVDDDLWNETVHAGYYTDGSIIEIMEKYRSDDINIKNNVPFYRQHERSNYARAISKLIGVGGIYGSIVVLQVTELTDAQKAVLPFVSDLTKKFIEHQENDIQYKGIRHQEAVLIDLLLGNIKNLSQLKNRIIATNLENANHFQLLSVPILEYNKIVVRNLREHFQSLFPRCWVVYHNNHLHILRISQNPIAESVFLFDKVEQLMQEYTSRICFGASLANLLHYLNKAKKICIHWQLHKVLGTKALL